MSISLSLSASEFDLLHEIVELEVFQMSTPEAIDLTSEQLVARQELFKTILERMDDIEKD